uniref:CLASP_N domain-containing protein n=1 Tax=Meloidogyne hapla TaxID=6305 RepID=A0A1I8B3D7_MELHA
MQSSNKTRVRPTNSGKLYPENTLNFNLASSLTAGAVSEEQFRQAFEAVLDLRVHSLKDLIAECQKQAVILENTNNDWTKRIKALQSLRGLIKHDIGCYGAFAEQVYGLLGTALELSVKDLRSQVCRETCMTISFFCEKLGTSFWRVAEAILPITLNLTQNSAKVMASSGRNCNIFITKNIHHSKILTLIVHHMSHKAKEIRRSAIKYFLEYLAIKNHKLTKMSIELICTIINQWDPTLIEKHSGEVTHSIKLALSDADSEARMVARQAFESLQSNYPTKAEVLFQELEPAKQRMLVERSSTASSTHSINSERDNLPNPNRGLYNAQNSAFLNKRSASDLNHSARRVNLVPPRIVRRPNPPIASNSATSVKPPITHPSPLVKKPASMTPTSHHRNGPALHTPVPLNIHKNGTTQTPLTAASMAAQTNVIKLQKVLAVLTDKNEHSIDNVENSLRSLTQLIKNGEIANWDEVFNDIFYNIQQTILHPLNNAGTVKAGALKAMKELCISQPKRLLTKTELLLLLTLDAHENDDAQVVRAAEECGAALATRLPTKTCVNLLLAVIDDENSKYHQLSGAIKMMSNLISKLPPDEVEVMMPTVVQRMVRCYENSQSMVRRASIICLVSMSVSIGLEKLKPHLNPSTLKLVEVYAARMAKRESY